METTEAKQAAQAVVALGNSVAAEYGYQVECQDAKEAVRALYEEYGPFEIDWGYAYAEPEWYDD